MKGSRIAVTATRASGDFANDDVAVRALHDGLQLGLLRGGNLKLVEGLPEVLEERLPLLRRDVEITMGVQHGAAGIPLRTTAGPAEHFRHQILEARRRNLVVRLIDLGIGVQAGVDHDAVDEVVDHRGAAVYTAEALVERDLWLRRGHTPSFCVRLPAWAPGAHRPP